MEKNNFIVAVEKNAIKDQGNGVVNFSKPLVITDDSEQRNGTKYDIKTMDISEYDGMITADHSMSIQEIIGETFGVMKGRSKVTIEGIKFAVKESALAQFAYDMLLGGFLKNFSIETIGPWPDDNGVYHDSKLVGLSAVVLGNNKSAALNSAVKNSLDHVKQTGLDTKKLESVLLSHNLLNPSIDMTFVTIKNNREFVVPISYKNAAGEEVEKDLDADESVDVSEDQKEAVENQIKVAVEPEKEPEPVPAANASDLIKNINESIVKPMQERMEKMEKSLLDKNAVEPKFKRADFAKKMNDMDWRARHGVQILAAWDFLKKGNAAAGQKLEDMNKFHLERLQQEGIVSNSMTIADFGNMVISPELLSEIEGFRSDFSNILARFPFRDTLSLQMGWLTRNGDVNMQEVELCDDGADGNLKPISEYDATFRTSNLMELAAVTPVCNAATRFLAADMLSDIAAGYRTDFDRKKAQLIIARLQQAVNSTGNTKVYGTTTDVNALKSFVEVWGFLQEEIMNGVFIFNMSTYAQLLSRAIGAGISGPLSNLFTTGNQPTILGSPFLIVPNELMPTLNTAETKTFVVEGVNVTINQGVFYVDPAIWSGRTSGGLQYDLSTDAAYEVGSDVRSAFQRNELVLRGSFFRGGAIRDNSRVVSMGSAGVS